jgi:hypothetical protein
LARLVPSCSRRLADFDRADRIGEFWARPETRTFGELLIDLEEDKYAKAVIWDCLGTWSGSSQQRLGGFE